MFFMSFVKSCWNEVKDELLVEMDNFKKIYVAEKVWEKQAY